MKPNNYTVMRGLSEFTATALLMIISCMGCTAYEHNANGRLISSLHYGLAIVAIMHIFGFISGAHANPCVSITCCLLGYIEARMMILYLMMQLAGAALGYFLLMQLLPQGLLDVNKQGVCMEDPTMDLSYAQILIIESILTSVLILGWCALWDVRSGRFLDSVTLRMGSLVIACNLAGSQLTGAIMNPAKILIPALYRGNPESVLLQLGGQLLASIVVPQFWQIAYTVRYRPLSAEDCERRSPDLYTTP